MEPIQIIAVVVFLAVAFGIFAVKEVKAKVGRNPKNPGKDIPIPARSIVKFKMGKTLKETLAKTSK